MSEVDKYINMIPGVYKAKARDYLKNTAEDFGFGEFIPTETKTITKTETKTIVQKITDKKVLITAGIIGVVAALIIFGRRK